jgi:protein-tyrosine sulfotransferase
MRMREPEPTAREAGVGLVADPVFVLCNGRSGSTLLRFLLDAHPDLACPPETNLPGLCAQLATVWSLIEGAPLSANRGDEPPEIPEAAIAGVRETMDRMVGSYLARRGKKRYCDKSLGTARYAELLTRVYPEARFVCVYRHPMDVIASGMEACPWGLNGYGFDPYIAATPGNAVMALANFWADNARVTLAAEERFPDRCFRLLYEDLVADPEAVAEDLFDFLGVAPVPGISRVCFSGERERFGPGDYKIWYTSAISADSVGRGWSVPTGMIAPQLLAVINDLAGKLGYLAIDSDWGTTAPPADLRVPVTAPPAGSGEQAPAEADGAGTLTAEAEGVPQAAAEKRPVMVVTGGPARSVQLGERLSAGLAVASREGGAGRWGPHGNETFVAVAVTKDPRCPAEYWLVDVGSATVTQVTKDAQEDSDWDLIGTLNAWEEVLDGEANLSVALRSCALRYCDNDETTLVAADTRIAMVAELLGLVDWR